MNFLDRFGMPQQLKSSSHWDQVLVFYLLYHLTINSIIIAIGKWNWINQNRLTGPRLEMHW